MVTALVLTAPWLLALGWVLFRQGLGLGDSIAPSMGDELRRRIAS